MSVSQRTQALQQDLRSTASELEQISRALQGHAAYLAHSVHQGDAELVRGQIHDLQATIDQLREIARSMTP